MKVIQFVEGSFVNKLITTLILINAVTLGLETVPSIMDKYGEIILFIDRR